MLDVITVAAVAVSRASFDLAHSHGWDLDQQHSTARYRRISLMRFAQMHEFVSQDVVDIVRRQEDSALV